MSPEDELENKVLPAQSVPVARPEETTKSLILEALTSCASSLAGTQTGTEMGTAELSKVNQELSREVAWLWKVLDTTTEILQLARAARIAPKAGASAVGPESQKEAERMEAANREHTGSGAGNKADHPTLADVSALAGRATSANPATPKAGGDAEGNRTFRILIAEDSEDCRFLLQEFLKSAQFKLTFTENGKLAVETARAQGFDLILMDIQMPVMDGLTATRLIRELEVKEGLAPIPILALTGNTRKADIDLSLGAGCNAHILKPVSKPGLLTSIQQHLPITTPPVKTAPLKTSSADATLQLGTVAG
jgi:CheY-like chemotaxis protein